MTFATPWSRPDVPGLVCPPPELTHVQQHCKDECDIHNILRRIEGGGDPSVLQARRGFYADLTEIGSINLMEAYDSIDRAEVAFESLPSELRLKFGNDPMAFAQYIDEHGVESVASLFGESAVATEPEPQDATTINDDATKGEGETP